LVVLAGIRAIPRELTEAAAIDGASDVTALRRIVLPLLTPTLLFAVVTTALTALENAFVPVQILTLGGPSGASNQLIYAIFQDGFQFFQAGKASALSVVTLALFAGFAFWQFRMLERRVVYER
jgi:ABC-type sugar transport system permease subunit